jgi:hypothetical protein
MGNLTESSGSTDTAPRALTNALRPLLQAQARRLRTRYLWHGLGLCLLLPTAALLLFFLLDHTLRLPVAVRLLHTSATVALLGYGLIRFVRYPLTRAFADIDMAQLLERRYPELHQRLVSAVQLQDVGPGQLRNQSQPMIEQLLAETSAAAAALPLSTLFDYRRTARVFAGTGSLLMIFLCIGLFAPETMRAFLLRHLGMATDYPRETTLRLEVPPGGPEVQRSDRDGVTELILPAGADLHVSVLAEGVVPKEVFLDLLPLVDDRQSVHEGAGTMTARTAPVGRSITMSPRPGDRFRHVFRRLSGSFSFHARGGDDEHGDRLVVVHTVHPPQVANIRASIVPPAYTGVARLEQNGGAIEALAGSNVEISVSTTAAVREATMVFLESGRRLPLAAQDIQDDSGTSLVHRGTFALENSDRYQIELVSESGLRNPNPGAYPVVALQDYAPVGRWLLPDDESTLLLPTAILCVRVDAHDDFGLAAVELGIEHSGGRSLQKDLLPAAAVPQKSIVLTQLFEVHELLAGARSEHEGLSLQLVLRDNKQPLPGTVEPPHRIVQIVDSPQLAESIAKAFRSLREETTQALDVQTDRRGKLDDLLANGTVQTTDLAQVLTNVEVGQSRVLGSCDRIHRGLMRAFDVHLWNRLETSQHAAEVVELYRQFSQNLQEPTALAPAFYRDLIQRRANGTLGAMETTLDPILAMIGIADELVSTALPQTTRLLAEAQVARPGSELFATLREAVQHQEHIQQSLQQLLLRLEEWNDYQDLIQEARALRDRQRDLQNRTEDARGKK